MSVGDDQNDTLRIVIALVAVAIIAAAVYVSKQRGVIIGDDGDDTGSSAFVPHPAHPATPPQSAPHGAHPTAPPAAPPAQAAPPATPPASPPPPVADPADPTATQRFEPPTQ